MCWKCDATGPICEYIDNPKWFLHTTKPNSANPPPLDELLTQDPQRRAVLVGAFDDTLAARTARRKAATSRKVKISSGTTP